MRVLLFILLLLIGKVQAQIINASPAYKPFVVTTINPPLDDVTGAAWAVSVRKLRTAYGGDCMRIRRTSDNTEQDIGFDGSGLIDTAAIKSFISTSHGRVVTFYDQSGNTVNAASTDTLTQPYIALHGNIIYIGGKPAVRQFAEGANSSQAFKHLFFTSTGAASSTFFVAGLINDGALDGTGVLSPLSGTVLIEIPFVSEFMFLPTTGSGSSNYGGSGTPSFYVDGNSVTATTRGQAATEFVAGNFMAHRLLSIINFNTSAWANFYTENTASGTVNGLHFFSEMIMYYSDKSGDRTTVETNINSFYNIY